MFPAILAAAILATPADRPVESAAAASRLASYITKRQPKAKAYAARLARSIIVQSKRVGLDPAVLAAVGWIESRYLRTARGSAQERGIWQLMRTDVRLAASWAKLRPTAPAWRSLSSEAITEALSDVEISAHLAADELAAVMAWCRRAGHRVRRWQTGDPLGKRWHRYQIDRVAHHSSGGKWPRRRYLRALRYTYKQIRKALNGR